LRNAAPGPHLFLGAPMTGYSETGADPSDKPMTDHRLHDVRLSSEQLRARVDRLADQGFRGITISYDVWPDQVDTIVAEANRRGLATIGELEFTSYPYAVRAGVGALLRNDQYLTELAPTTAKLARADSLPAGAAAVRALCTIDPTSSVVQDYGDELAHSHTALMPTLSMEATADLLDIASPWTAKSSVLIKPTDLDIPADPVTGTSGFLLSLPVDRRWHVRQCAFYKEMLDGQLYAAGAKFLAGAMPRRTESCRAAEFISNSHCSTALSSRRAKHSPRLPATMPLCSAGEMSGASNPAVSQTFYSSMPIRERMSQPSTESVRSCLKVQLWTATLCWQWAERISRGSNRGLQMRVSYCLSSRACANPPEEGTAHRSAGSWSGLGGHLVAVRTQIPHIFEVHTQNLSHAPSLSNTSAWAMRRVTLEDLRDMT
jgi:hypothetical protein